MLLSNLEQCTSQIMQIWKNVPTFIYGLVFYIKNVRNMTCGA